MKLIIDQGFESRPATLEDLKAAAAELGYALVPTDERLREKQADEAIDSELRIMAVESCRTANGCDWNVMFYGDQEAEISAWIDGFKAGLSYKRR